ncbi:C-type lectin domain family 4 member A-like [Mobula birostris]|uniref:C-type lectin domain family 4 member A-like n=1 Tax=Mobula birostris TaxID=1983395 RepID=UPI003B28B236
MEDSETYMNVKFSKTDSGSPSRVEWAEPDVTYVEINFKSPSEPRVRTDEDGLNSTYSELKFRKEEPRIDEDKDPPICSGPGGLPTTAQAGAHEQESKLKIGNRPNRQICLLCLVTSALIVTVIGLSIHASQLLHQFTEMEAKFRSVKETKAQICEFLTSRRGQTCPQTWLRNKDRCYFMSTFVTTLIRAVQECSNFDSRLLEINSQEEASFVFRALASHIPVYWIGKCERGKVGSGLLYYVSSGTPVCIQCQRRGRNYPCHRDRRFICEKSTPLYPANPENIQDLCQQAMGAS